MTFFDFDDGEAIRDHFRKEDPNGPQTLTGPGSLELELRITRF
jgi:hypothetical protein